MRVEFDEGTRAGLVIWIRPDNQIELIAQVPSSCGPADVELIVKSLLASILELGIPPHIERIEKPASGFSH